MHIKLWINSYLLAHALSTTRNPPLLSYPLSLPCPLSFPPFSHSICYLLCLGHNCAVFCANVQCSAHTWFWSRNEPPPSSQTHKASLISTAENLTSGMVPSPSCLATQGTTFISLWVLYYFYKPWEYSVNGSFEFFLISFSISKFPISGASLQVCAKILDI